MTIYRLDIEKRLPWTFSTSGYYYWTNCYYIAASTLADAVDFADQTIDYDFGWLIDQVEVGTWKLTNLTTDAVVYQLHSYHPRPIVHYPGEPMGIANVMHVSGQYEDGTRFYKRYRFPLRAEDITSGGGLSSTMLLHFGSLAPALCDFGWIVNQSGSPLASARLSPRAHSWVWRDGTKRRSRSVLFP